MPYRMMSMAALAALLAVTVTVRIDSRAELERAVRQVNVGAFVYQLTEDDVTATASFVNPAVRRGMKLDRRNPHADIQITQVRDKKTGAVKTYRAEIVPAGRSAAIRITDLSTNKVISTEAFVPAAICNVDNKKYPSQAACNADFDCACLPAVLCEANRTCQDQRVDYECCVTGQTVCADILRLVRPTSVRCQVAQ